MKRRRLLLALAVFGLVASACSTTASDVVDDMEPRLVEGNCDFLDRDYQIVSRRNYADAYESAYKYFAETNTAKGLVEESGVTARYIFDEMVSRCCEIRDRLNRADLYPWCDVRDGADSPAST